MKWNLMLGAMVAVGLLGATEVRAQDTAAESAAAATPAQQPNAAPAYGAWVNGPSTVDADGVPVAEPNAISDFANRAKAFDGTEVGMPMVAGPGTDGSASAPTK
jgi:hypothetical protein